MVYYCLVSLLLFSLGTYVSGSVETKDLPLSYFVKGKAVGSFYKEEDVLLSIRADDTDCVLSIFTSKFENVSLLACDRRFQCGKTQDSINVKIYYEGENCKNRKICGGTNVFLEDHEDEVMFKWTKETEGSLTKSGSLTFSKNPKAVQLTYDQVVEELKKAYHSFARVAMLAAQLSYKVWYAIYSNLEKNEVPELHAERNVIVVERFPKGDKIDLWEAEVVDVGEGKGVVVVKYNDGKKVISDESNDGSKYIENKDESKTDMPSTYVSVMISEPLRSLDDYTSPPFVAVHSHLDINTLLSKHPETEKYRQTAFIVAAPSMSLKLHVPEQSDEKYHLEFSPESASEMVIEEVKNADRYVGTYSIPESCEDPDNWPPPTAEPDGGSDIGYSQNRKSAAKMKKVAEKKFSKSKRNKQRVKRKTIKKHRAEKLE